jgi:phenylalanyl-tRNA synthetase alpha chain
MTLSEFQQQLAQVEAQLATVTKANEPQDGWRAAFFGKKQGSFTQVSKIIGQTEATDRAQAGQLLQQLKQKIEDVLTASEAKGPAAWQDPTIPAEPFTPGRLHPLSQAIHEITDIFAKIGFTRSRYPEVDWDHYAFSALNMPQNHPARDDWETFFVDAPANEKLGKMVLTPHTSNGQVREMERLHGKPPIRMINIGRCYRRQQDITHTQMFHQFEGLVVDEGITIQHLKGTIEHFAREFYGEDATARIRPFHFQFTEPSFEVDFSCSICHGTGQLDGEKCRFCKSGWHEVGGAGMVHPNVLRAGGIDPEKYTGFAFGWGIERTYALRPGLHLDDIRLLFNGDLRFLEQF